MTAFAAAASACSGRTGDDTSSSAHGISRPAATAVDQSSTATSLADDLGAIGPRRDFTRQFPESVTVASVDGQRLVHASGFTHDSGARLPQDAAFGFLSLRGAAFGLTSRQSLAVKTAPPAGQVGAVRFERSIDGLPVFGGDITLGVDGQSRVFAVNGGDVPSLVSGGHTLGEAAARAAAVAGGTPGFEGGARDAGSARVAAGWRPLKGEVRAVYRVDFISADPPGDWRVFVDGDTGEVLFRQDLRRHASAPGTVFEVSPVENAAEQCPLDPSGGHSACATPVQVTFQNLTTGADLTGTQVSVYNCEGRDPSSDPTNGSCAAVEAAGGGFNFEADPTYRSATDDFAAAMAYYHADKHISFFKSLDPNPPTGSGRAVSGSLPALVNAFENGAPIDNAYFSPLLDAVLFGQGPTADYAYDATIVYHEFTHAVVHAWGDFQLGLDPLGTVFEPQALGEGTADAMAASETGRSQLASFVAGTDTPPAAYIRDMHDPDILHTCQGDGRQVTTFGTSSINGLDGEEHDDGEIWNGFYWEVYQGLKTAGVKACSGACEAGPAIQYLTLQLAGGTLPTFASYWQTMKDAAARLFPSKPEVASYVECVAKRHKLDTCDRTVPVYADETKLQYVTLQYSPFQIVIQNVGPGQLDLCSTMRTQTRLYLRKGQPVQVSSSSTYDRYVDFAQDCSSGSFHVDFGADAAGTWYLLFDSPGAMYPGYDIYTVHVGTTGMATRPTPPAPTTCSPPTATPLTISPEPAEVAPGGSLTFTASGGSGTGYTWSLASNPSGGSITPDGVYTAGSTGSVTDVVNVADSIGGTATRDVTVPAGESDSGSGSWLPGCGTGTGGMPALALALAALLTRRSKGARRSSGKNG